MGTPAKPRRRYDSPLRRQQSTETLEHILTTGVELMYGALEWDITRLNARTIAEHAGISMRTVQRYFPNERALRDAIMQRSVDKSGISLDKLTLDTFAKTTIRMFQYLASLPVTPLSTTPMKDPTYAAMDRERRDAVLRAVIQAAPDWSERERSVVAGVLDVLWSIPSYERLVASWGLDSGSAIGALAWLVDLVNGAVRAGHKPVVKH
jgi:AcrR family transcriptional regulator